ncbi:hypothetical protein J6590_023046 [Homalodisca vitripennis]|nr:hypothetical protein J6590_023046 [Homalodisca vitripennis]
MNVQTADAGRDVTVIGAAMLVKAMCTQGDYARPCLCIRVSYLCSTYLAGQSRVNMAALITCDVIKQSGRVCAFVFPTSAPRTWLVRAE